VRGIGPLLRERAPEKGSKRANTDTTKPLFSARSPRATATQTHRETPVLRRPPPPSPSRH
jgi:hypothetical protein